jgi:hypothetical protein
MTLRRNYGISIEAIQRIKKLELLERIAVALEKNNA